MTDDMSLDVCDQSMGNIERGSEALEWQLLMDVVLSTIYRRNDQILPAAADRS
jgi:hypothetical protein